MKPALRVLIVDDEALARERLHSLLENEADVEVVGEAAGGEQAIEQIDRLSPDLVFLDIDMPRMDGFDVAAQLFPDEKPLIVFVTGYDGFALRAFEASALDYLLKPVDSPRLQRALQRAQSLVGGAVAQPQRRQFESLLESINHRDGPRDRLAIRNGVNYTILRISDVVWIEADGNYVVLHTDKTDYRHRASMSEIIALLDPREFIRIHRSTIVSINRVTLLESWGFGEFLFTLANGKKLPSSRRYRNAIRDVFGV